MRAEFRQLRTKHPGISELKWSRVSGKQPYTVYTDLVDLFSKSPAAPFLEFKCIVVRRSDDPSDILDKHEKDVGFYKAYYTLLRWRLAGGSDNHILVDKRQGPVYRR